MNHTCVTLDDKGAFGRQETETTIRSQRASCVREEKRPQSTCVKFQSSQTLTLTRVPHSRDRTVRGWSRSHAPLYAPNPEHQQHQTETLTVGSSCSSRRCVSPRRRTKRRCSASHTPDTPNPSLLFTAAKILPLLSVDQFKSFLSNCVNRRGGNSQIRFQWAVRKLQGGLRSTSVLAAAAAAAAAAVRFHTGATCLFGGECPAPLPRGQPIEMQDGHTKPAHNTDARLNTSSWLQKTQKQVKKEKSYILVLKI